MTALDESFTLTVSSPIILCSTSTLFPFSQVGNPFLTEPFSMVSTQPCQVGVTPRKSEGIEPFTTVNTPPCPVGVTPRKSGGLEPLNMVNTPPCQVKVSPLHPINTLLGHLKDASSPLILTPGS